MTPEKKITPGNLFRDFFNSEKAGGLVLIGCTVLSMLLANSAFGPSYLHFWHQQVDLSFAWVKLDHNLEEWINDGLMAVFFLMVGLEIERELYIGELSEFRNALLPVMAAFGGMAIPALIHLLFNQSGPAQNGIGIPMATDIAFSLGVLSLLGSRVPPALKIFLTALAIIDDLGAIMVIALFYTKSFSALNLGISLGIFVILLILNRLRIRSLWAYLLPGILMWYFMFHSGVHATISGVLLAFAIPFSKTEGKKSPSYILQHALHKPVNFIIIPLFALANTGILVGGDWLQQLKTSNSMGIMAGLVLGKPAGILSFCWLFVQLGLCRLPEGINWKILTGAGLLAGIGFTMSIFISNLAFDEKNWIEESKMAVLIASFVAAIGGWTWLSLACGKENTSRKIVSG